MDFSDQFIANLPTDLECPYCNSTLLIRFHKMWSGKRNIIYAVEYQCVQQEPSHSFSLKIRTEEELFNHLELINKLRLQ
jgi:hypothetical protein